MTRLETRIRDSLQARAQDVEPTPALWQRVSGLVDRRMRARRVLYAVAGATAAVVLAVVVVPNVMELFTPEPGSPQILDTPDGTETSPPSSGTAVPEHTVTTDGSALYLVESATGETVRGLGLAPMDAEAEAVIEAVAVRPGSTPDDLTVAYLRLAEGSYEIHYVHSVNGEIVSAGVAAQRGWLNFNVPAEKIEPPVPVWSGDGSELAWVSTGTEGGDPGRSIIYLLQWSDDGPVDGGREGATDVLRIDELVPGALKLQDWVGDREDGYLLGTIGQLGLMESANTPGMQVALRDIHPSDEFDGQFEAELVEQLSEEKAVIDVAHAADDATAGTTYRLVAGGTVSQDAEASGLRIEVDEGDDLSGEMPVPASLAQTADPFGVWMTAAGDGVLVGHGQEAFVLTRDGGAEPTPLPDGTIYADFLPAADAAPVPMATAEPTEAPSETPPADAHSPQPSPAEATVVGPRHVVVAGLRTLSLVDRQTGGTQELVSLSPIGESAIERVAVRPGSTPTDLTAVYLTHAEGMWDLRYVVVSDGQVVESEVFPEGLRPTTETNVEEGSVPAPVWSPGGDVLAWAETRDGAQNLVVIGWDDGPGTGDPNTNRVDFGLAGVDGPVAAQDWTLVTDDGTTQHGALVLTGVRDDRDVIVEQPIDVQGDGAPALPSEAKVVAAQTPTLDASYAPGPASGRGPQLDAILQRDGDAVQLLLRQAGGESSTVALDQLAVGGNPYTSLWLTTLHGSALVGNGEHALLVTESGQIADLGVPEGMTTRYLDAVG